MNKDRNKIRNKTYSYISTDGSGMGMVVVPLSESYVPKDTEDLNGVVFKQVDEFHIDVSLIPDHIRDSLAAASLEAFKEWMKDPDKRKMIEERTRTRKACQETTKQEVN